MIDRIKTFAKKVKLVKESYPDQKGKYYLLTNITDDDIMEKVEKICNENEIKILVSDKSDIKELLIKTF